jgi:hypothetical protein
MRATASNTRIYLPFEDVEGYKNILNYKYVSKYESRALIESLKPFE